MTKTADMYSAKWHKGFAVCDCGSRAPLEYSSCGDYVISDGWSRNELGEYMCDNCVMALRGITGKLTGEKTARSKRSGAIVTSKELSISDVFYSYTHNRDSIYGYSSSCNPVNVIIAKKHKGKRPYSISMPSSWDRSSRSTRASKAGMQRFIRVLQQALTEL